MSKQGRIQPRRILFTVALSAIEHNPVIKSLYQYHLGQGRKKMDAIGICMHKILRIIFGMLKNNTAFDPKIDSANRLRMLSTKPIDPKKTKIVAFRALISKPRSPGAKTKKEWNESSPKVSTTLSPGSEPPFQ